MGAPGVVGSTSLRELAKGRTGRPRSASRAAASSSVTFSPRLFGCSSMSAPRGMSRHMSSARWACPRWSRRSAVVDLPLPLCPAISTAPPSIPTALACRAKLPRWASRSEATELLRYALTMPGSASGSGSTATLRPASMVNAPTSGMRRIARVRSATRWYSWSPMSKTGESGAGPGGAVRTGAPCSSSWRAPELTLAEVGCRWRTGGRRRRGGGRRSRPRHARARPTRAARRRAAR